jgi:hypothetical protein
MMALMQNAMNISSSHNLLLFKFHVKTSYIVVFYVHNKIDYLGELRWLLRIVVGVLVDFSFLMIILTIS